MRKKRKEKFKRKINWRKEAKMLPSYIILFAWIGFLAIMLLWILGASLSTSREIFSGTVFKFESGFNLDNYIRAWTAGNVSQYFSNSLVYCVVGCVGVLLIAAPGAYTLSRISFRGNKLIRTGMVLAMSIPSVMIVLPIYAVAVNWDIKGRLLLMILYVCMLVPFSTTYLINFFANLSTSYEEAAALDGCTPGKTFWLIMLPLIQPALITVTVFNFLSIWNEYFMALIFSTSTDMTPVGLGLMQILSAMKYSGDYGGLFAAVIIVFVPTFVVYIVMSEKIISGVTGGGIKG